MCNDHDLCLIQEHWLLPDHLKALNISDSSDLLSVGVSGMDDSELILGCPCGGCGTLILSAFVRCPSNFVMLFLTLMLI